MYISSLICSIQVCDLYLELVKPVVQGPAPSNNTDDTATAPTALTPEQRERRQCAQATLYTVLEQFLRLCHPLMPFVTEELWQRLPNIPSLTTKPSIMVSAYPTEVPQWFRPDLEVPTLTIFSC